MTFAHDTFSPRPGITLAYKRTRGTSAKLPGVVFLGGYRSDMQGVKAGFLEARCAARGQDFLRFDYTGHGLSSGTFEDGTIGAWLQDALDVFDAHTAGPQVVVGSSMGGWIALLLALRRKDRLAGLAGIAPAPDFTEDVWNHEFSEAQRQALGRGETVYLPTSQGSPHPMTPALFGDGARHLVLKEKFALPCPVRLIHGKKDASVPWQKSEQIAAMCESPDLKIAWVADGDHRLSRPEDLEKIDGMVEELSRG